MDEQLTTKQVAVALQVSESSVKRWCDRGAIPTTRTLGGHRRIPLAELLTFLETSNRQVVVPLPQLETGIASWEKSLVSPGDLRERFGQAIIRGDEDECRKILVESYTRSKDFAALADKFIGNTFHEVGQLWDCGVVEVYQERRGCEVCSRVLYELRRLVPKAPPNAPVALGGSPVMDQYTLPSQLVELVLRECGWSATNLGANLPLESLLAAIVKHRPKMVWISVSHLTDEEAFINEYAQFFAAKPDDVLVVLGGRALTDSIRPRLSYTGFCDNMVQLSAFARALHGRPPKLELTPN